MNKIKEFKNVNLASRGFTVLWKVSGFIAKGLVIFCYEILRDVVIALARLTKFLLVGFVNMLRGWKPMTKEQALAYHQAYSNLNNLFTDYRAKSFDSSYSFLIGNVYYRSPFDK